MKLRLQEDPREWSKDTLFAAGGLAVLASLLHWRGILPRAAWLAVLSFAAVAAVGGGVVPRWFRGWSRFSRRLGFHVACVLGLVFLAVFFIVVITPMGLALRALGRNPLDLRFRAPVESYWRPARKNSPLDSLF
jgi:hypothetical protein